MPINNTPKPSTTLNNVSRPYTGETWASITTSWASETRSWMGAGSFIRNVSKPSSVINNTPRP